MNNQLQFFKHEMFGELQVFVDNGNVYFPASEVASILGYSNPRKAILDHCKKDGVMIRDIIDLLGRKQQKKFINEGNLYRLIVKSKLPEAQKFESWVFEEVLPTIRKTGGYVTNEDLFINTYLPFADEQTKLLFRTTLNTVRKQNELIAAQQKQIEQQQKEIEHKENVIIVLVDEIDLATKRQILNRVVRNAETETHIIGKRWSELYKQFKIKYHIDLNKRK
ncbi:Bro-N domain-containing protein [Anoxybacillus flavithermus]|uniref:BRO family protein n=1 Tax=Anoxybacillus flavithermus TaxID=33934 RepID=A0A178T4S2_9BACL|nr:BRO family protein [Anoxybacillus flavithermus]OAO76335.1 BRO family protein [Anoxybacillus flavithermus]